MIKARACAGDIAAGEKFLRELSPFIWRKYLDFAAVADIHAMKRQIHAYRGHGEIAVEGHNIKLGRGGIREIEFFVQTQQLDRRRPPSGAARPRDAGDARRCWPSDGWIDAPARDELGAAYRFLRMRRAPAADGRGRADPHAAGRPRGARALRPLLRLCRSRQPSPTTLLGHLRNVQRQYATPVRERAGRRGARRALSLSRPRPTTARRSTSLDRHGLQAAARSLGAGAAMAVRAATGRCAASRPATQLAELVPVLLDAFRALLESGRRAAGVRPFPGGTARRRPPVLAAAAESRPDRADCDGARHRAAARRHPRAVPARHGRA